MPGTERVAWVDGMVPGTVPDELTEMEWRLELTPLAAQTR
jgi:hypothetical protein